MDKNSQADGIKRINAGELLREVFRQKYVIIALLILGVLGSFLYTKLFCKPVYTSCAKIYIQNASEASINTNDVTLATYLTQDYLELIVDRTVLNEVCQSLDLAYGFETLKNLISLNNPENTRIIEVYVNTNNAAESQRIANKICEVAQKKIVDLMDVNQVNLFSEAYRPTAPSNVNLLANMKYGFLAAITLCCLYVFLRYYRNDKINTQEDVQKYLGLCTLGVIPFNQGKSRKAGAGKRTARD